MSKDPNEYTVTTWSYGQNCPPGYDPEAVYATVKDAGGHEVYVSDAHSNTGNARAEAELWLSRTS